MHFAPFFSGLTGLVMLGRHGCPQKLVQIMNWWEKGSNFANETGKEVGLLLMYYYYNPSKKVAASHIAKIHYSQPFDLLCNPESHCFFHVFSLFFNILVIAKHSRLTEGWVPHKIENTSVWITNNKKGHNILSKQERSITYLFVPEHELQLVGELCRAVVCCSCHYKSIFVDILPYICVFICIFINLILNPPGHFFSSWVN